MVTAISMSCYYPIIFLPIINDNKCFIDGALINNFPIREYIKNTNYKVDISDNKVDISNNKDIFNYNYKNVLGIKINDLKILDNSYNNIFKNSNMFYYLFKIFTITLNNNYYLMNSHLNFNINLIECNIKNNNPYLWKKMLYQEKLRKHISNIGYKSSKKFIKNYLNNNNI